VGFVTFEVLHCEGHEAAAGLVEAFTAQATDRVGRTPGLVSSPVHQGVTDPVVVRRAEWTDERAHRAATADTPAVHALRTLAGRPGVTRSSTFRGTPVPGLDGPAVGRAPGVVVVATRHLGGPDSVRTLLGLLHDGGAWKSRAPGFIAALPYVGADGKTFVNYPMWTDRAAYRAWMADPRIPAGQEDIARLEVAPPEYLLCTVVSDVRADPTPDRRAGGNP